VVGSRCSSVAESAASPREYGAVGARFCSVGTLEPAAYRDRPSDPNTIFICPPASIFTVMPTMTATAPLAHRNAHCGVKSVNFADLGSRSERALVSNSTPTTSFQALMDQLREEFGRIAYTHKTHMKMADRLNARLLLEKRITAALLALTAGDSVGVLVSNAQCAKIIAVALSGVALLVTVYGLSRARDRLAEEHRKTADALWSLREYYVHLIGDLKGGSVSVDDARVRRDSLTEAAARVYSSAPATNAKAYEDAQKALKANEELTFSQHEIDVMLPLALRSGANSPRAS
jgi:hypothetical protein